MDERIASFLKQTLLRKEDNITYNCFEDGCIFDDKEDVLALFVTVLHTMLDILVVEMFTTLAVATEDAHIHCFVINQDGTMDILLIEIEDSTGPDDAIKIMRTSFDENLELIQAITGCTIVCDDIEIHPSYLLAYGDVDGKYHLLTAEEM